MNQNFYNSNSLGFDQTQPSQFPVIHPPPQETNIKILHDQENVINSVQTFLRKFNRYSSFETPKVLLLAWCRVFEIKDAFRNEQYKPEDIQELFCKLFNDVQNIHEELTEYINTPGWNRPASYNNGDDDDVDYTIAITPVLSTEEPDNSLSMGDEHLDTILATESDEVIKYSVEDIVPSPSESEGIPDTMCDVHLVNNPTPLEAKDHFEIVINSNDDYSSSNEDSFYNENIEYVEASPHDSEVVSLEVAEIVIPKDEEIEDDNLHEKLNLLDLGKWIPILNSGIRKNLSSTTRVNLPVENDHSPLLAYVVWIFLSYLTLLHLAGSQPMLKSSYKAEDGVIISIPLLVGGVADVVVEIKGTGWSISFTFRFSVGLQTPDDQSRSRLGFIEKMGVKGKQERTKSEQNRTKREAWKSPAIPISNHSQESRKREENTSSRDQTGKS
uniref:Uncharacterized protein n=1 Tax=Tanacetum cinerariifolium TaxID=118510 RepID=A0A6L2NYT2_TANCI|nr:hypothetical protein [Tanacetum cinerariifolium]